MVNVAVVVEAHVQVLLLDLRICVEALVNGVVVFKVLEVLAFSFLALEFSHPGRRV